MQRRLTSFLRVIRALPWEEYLPEDGKFWVTKATSVKSKLFSPSDIQSIVKKAMVERMEKAYGNPVVSGERCKLSRYAYSFMKDEAVIGLDTTGNLAAQARIPSA